MRAPSPHSTTPPARAPHPRAELDALHELAVLVAEHHDLRRLLTLILERAGSLLDVDDAYLYLCGEDGMLEVRAGTGIFASQVGFTLPHGTGLAGRVVRTGEPLTVDDYCTWEGRALGLESAPFHAVAGVPLVGRFGVIGVIGLARTSPQRTFGDEEVGLLDRFGRLAALALENARLHESARRELAERRRAEEELLDTVARLSRSELDLRQAQAETIRRLADAAEFRDAETGRHTGRMARLCEQIARRLGLDEDRCRLLRDASPLHDIGKIAIPDDILLKPEGFTDAERDVMRRHAEIGHRLLSGSASEVLDLAATIALTHHERWDGTGYPQGLRGDQIPLEGRIASVADVFDALTADRVYRPALTAEAALAAMEQERGGQFDPVVLDALVVHLRGPDAADRPGSDDDRGALAAAEPSRDATAEPRVEATADPGGEARDDAPPPGLLTDIAFRAACRSAERQLDGGGRGRHALEAALAQLCTPFGESLLASVYAVDHDRLWLVAQYGYREVLDGFPVGHGVMGRAARTGATQSVSDVGGDADFVAAVGGITSEVAVPFSAAGEVVGVLNVEGIGVRLPATAADGLVGLADRLGARIEEVREGIGSDVGQLLRLCVHASSLRGVGAIAELAARTTGRILGLESAQVDLWRTEDPRPRLVSFWRRHDVQLDPLGPDVLLQLDLAVDADLTAGIVGAHQAGLDDEPTTGVVVLPLRVGGATIGMATGRLVGDAPEQERLEAATLFAQHAAALIDVASALRREQRAAVTDQLTGLLNRRGFEERLQEEILRATRDAVPFSVVLCDCDGLKAMNDAHGHELGDALLEVVASCLRTSKRVSDVAARLGGDEFALIVPEAEAGTALAIIDRVREALAACRVAGCTPSASFGSASFPVDARSATALLRAADEALYRAKAGVTPAGAGEPRLGA